ncbi:MAG: DNA polymerase III subunit chi [Pseudomonadales bacterium]
MTRVDFYILPDNEPQARLQFICRLVEKAYRHNHQVYIHTDNPGESGLIDELLWNFRAESFVPHHRLEDGSTTAPVAIGHGETPGEHHDILINLSSQVPDFFSRFERCAEVVVQQQDILAATRNHFAFYKERGYPLHTHDLRK